MKFEECLFSLCEQLKSEGCPPWAEIKIFELTPVVYQRSFGGTNPPTKYTVSSAELVSPPAFAVRFAEICRVHTWIHVEAVTLLENVLIVMVEHSLETVSTTAEILLAEKGPHIRLITSPGEWHRPFQLIR